MISVSYMPDTHGGAYDQPEPSPEAAAAFAEQLLVEGEHAERHNFDGLYVPERHARTECMFPSPLGLLLALAARTSRVTLGTFVIMPPLYNPVALAEEAAMIDVLSRGRLILGVGVGYHPRYFAHFGVPIKQREGRFEECMEIITKAWTTVGPFAHHGKYYNYEAIHVTPKPYQRPRPTLLVGAFGPKSIARAGRIGDGWAMAPFLDRIENIKSQIDIYREAAAKAGKQPRIVLFRDGYIAPTLEEAEQTFGRLWLEECKFYFKWGMLAPTEDFRSEADFTLENIRGKGHAIIGTADDWLEQLAYWHKITGCEGFVFRARVPMGPDRPRTLECIQRLGEEVIPKLKRGL